MTKQDLYDAILVLHIFTRSNNTHFYEIKYILFTFKITKNYETFWRKYKKAQQDNMKYSYPLLWKTFHDEYLIGVEWLIWQKRKEALTYKETAVCLQDDILGLDMIEYWLRDHSSLLISSYCSQHDQCYQPHPEHEVDKDQQPQEPPHTPHLRTH